MRTESKRFAFSNKYEWTTAGWSDRAEPREGSHSILQTSVSIYDKCTINFCKVKVGKILLVKITILNGIWSLPHWMTETQHGFNSSVDTEYRCCLDFCLRAAKSTLWIFFQQDDLVFSVRKLIENPFILCVFLKRKGAGGPCHRPLPVNNAFIFWIGNTFLRQGTIFIF